MEKSSQFSTSILQILAARYYQSYTLDEIAMLINPVFNTSTIFKDQKYIERENQARIINELLLLNDEGYIFLNSKNDQSCITIKGLIKIKNIILFN